MQKQHPVYDLVTPIIEKMGFEVVRVMTIGVPIDGNYSLEVSSPVIDRPLTKPEHFSRFAGYEAKVETDEPVEGRKRFKGKIISISPENVIRFAMDDKEYDIPFEAVAKAKLVLTDELWNEFAEAAENND